jgi:hypothetical protein
MRVAAPLASTFVIYLLGLLASVAAFRKARVHLKHARYAAAFGSLIVGAVTGFWSFTHDSAPARAEFVTIQQPANEPIGEARGIFPGRVVWVHDPDATNENCSPSSVGHEWYRPENNDQQTIDAMVSTAIRGLTGTTTDAAAWNAIFRYHNATRGKGSVGYAAGEKVFLKINIVSGWSGNYNPSDLTPRTGFNYTAISETSPAIVLSVLRQLVNVVGVAQSDIYVGDPIRHIYKHCYDLWHAEFPNVHYLDVSGYTNLGREPVQVSTTARVWYSDRGSVLKSNGSTGTPITDDQLYTVFEDAEYILNIPQLKGHRRAGVTMFAKNHFGSHTRASAAHLHNGLVWPEEMAAGKPSREGYGLYRVQVDLLGHKLLGKKHLFYLMDALWSTDFEINSPLKWKMAPFNNDWTSSVFASFDPIAIESVGYDFLRTEFTAERGAGTYPQMNGADDYLHQAADSTNWPAGFKYDPEKDGTPLPRSLGTHEHWNDGTHRQYSRNLGTGNGIELVSLSTVVSVADRGSRELPGEFALEQNYPNPFNASTIIRYRVPSHSNVKLEIFNITGEKVRTLVNEEQEFGAHFVSWDGTTESGKSVASGVYVYRLQISGTKGTLTHARRLVLVK